MKPFNLKSLASALLATSLLAGCTSTDPYTPQSEDDFVYDPDMSFAMNVIEGSLELHNGLRDTRLPENSSVSPGALDYAADGIIGAAFGGGISGALLSMMGTNQGNEPLHTYYGIVYYPVKEKGNVQAIFDDIEQELIETAERTRKIKFVEKTYGDAWGKAYLSFEGEDCALNSKLWGGEHKYTCTFIHYLPPKLLKYTTNTPDGEQGLFAVIGFERFSAATYLSFDLDKKYYLFSPAMRGRTRFPFVFNDGKVYPFVKPTDEQPVISLTVEELMTIDPWVNKHYGAVSNR